MIFLKFWFSVCFLFFIHSISQLFEDARLVKYLKSENDENAGKTANFSFCVALNESALKPFKRSTKNDYKFTIKKLLNSTCSYYFSREICQKSVLLTRSYVFNYHVCFNFKADQFDVLVRKSNVTKYRIFVYPLNESEIFLYYNFEFTSKFKPYLLILTVKQIKSLGKGYKTDCRNYSNKNTNFQTSETIYYQSACLYECFKSKTSRSLSYYYTTQDTKQLTVDPGDLERSQKIYWKISDIHLKKNIEQKCKKLCDKVSCTTFQILIYLSLDNQKTFNITVDYTLSQPKPFISDFILIFDSLSLVALMFNFSLLVTFSAFTFRLIRKFFYLYLKIYGRYLPVAYLRKSYWALKISTLSLCLSLLISFSVYRIVQFAEHNYDYIESTSFPTEIIPFYWVVCVPVQMFLRESTELDLRLENELLANHSFAYLENLTSFGQFELGIEKIQIEYATIVKEVKYSINKEKVLFRNYDYKLNGSKDSNFLTRCYEIEFDTKGMDKRRYEMLFSLSDLRLKANFDWFVVFPLVRNRKMNYKSRGLFSKRNFKKVTHKRNLNCTDYEKFYRDCSSYGSCSDWCVLDKFRAKHSNLTTFAVVEESKINQTDLTRLYFNRTFDQQISEDCNIEFKSSNCYTEYFTIEDSQPKNLKNETFLMNLYYSHHMTYQEFDLTLHDLLLNNLLNFLSIFLGFNVGKLFALLKKLRVFKLPKLYKYFKLLVCLLGFSFHIYVLLNNALSGNLVYFVDFSRFKVLEIPNLIFCFKFNEDEIEPNRMLTYAYLDELTKDLNFSFFRDLSFLDEDYEMVHYQFHRKDKAKEKLQKVYWFYFLDLKCFEFKFRPIKNDQYAYLLNWLRLACLKFNKEVILNYYNLTTSFDFYFINKEPSTHELNGIDRMTLNSDSKNGSKQLLSVDSNLVVFKQEDIFTYVKQPLSLVFETVNLNDTTEYIQELLRGFKRFGLKTKEIPLFTEGEEKNQEIDVSITYILLTNLVVLSKMLINIRLT